MDTAGELERISWRSPDCSPVSLGYAVNKTPHCERSASPSEKC